MNGPRGKTVLLGDYTEFECTTTEAYPDWVINGTELDLRRESVHRDRGITRSYSAQVGSNLFRSRVRVHATKINNNTAIQCSQGEPALLKIQGT